jgi:hypothetical protein
MDGMAFFTAKQAGLYLTARSGKLTSQGWADLAKACGQSLVHPMPVDADWKGHSTPPED